MADFIALGAALYRTVKEQLAASIASLGDKWA
jgi:hypothetical protein